ncbi:hypothetical protein BKA80DRAFT_267379 [Phyllosticta citrichinensis]
MPFAPPFPTPELDDGEATSPMPSQNLQPPTSVHQAPMSSATVSSMAKADAMTKWKGPDG